MPVGWASIQGEKVLATNWTKVWRDKFLQQLTIRRSSRRVPEIRRKTKKDSILSEAYLQKGERGARSGTDESP